MLRNKLIFAYGTLAYCAAMGVITYLMGFSFDVLVPVSVDRGAAASVGAAVAINTVLIALFGIQHAIMARPRFKRWITRFIPKAAERSTFVLIAAGLLTLICTQWRPIGYELWNVENGVLRGIIFAISAMGWLLVLGSTFIINHFELFGMAQVWRQLKGLPDPEPTFQAKSAYRFVRHPLMLGFLVAFWFAPTMTAGHALFAGVFTVYILIGVRMEERDLVASLGTPYRQYQMQTPALFPGFGRKPQQANPAGSSLTETAC